MRRILTLSTAAACGILVGAGCDAPDPRDDTGRPVAAETYTQYCEGCHGSSGTRGPAGARLAESGLPAEETLAVILNGRGAMPAWRRRLPPDQIEAVASYIRAFRNKEMNENAPN